MSNLKTVIIVDEDLFNKLLRKVDNITENLNILNSSKKQVLESTWLTSAEVCALLNISPRKLQQLRSDNLIQFNKAGKKIYYKSSWIDEYLDNSN